MIKTQKRRVDSDLRPDYQRCDLKYKKGENGRKTTSQFLGPLKTKQGNLLLNMIIHKYLTYF